MITYPTPVSLELHAVASNEHWLVPAKSYGIGCGITTFRNANPGSQAEPVLTSSAAASLIP